MVHGGSAAYPFVAYNRGASIQTRRLGLDQDKRVVAKSSAVGARGCAVAGESPEWPSGGQGLTVRGLGGGRMG
jgi:hypothetical protein